VELSLTCQRMNKGPAEVTEYRTGIRYRYGAKCLKAGSSGETGIPWQPIGVEPRIAKTTMT